MTQSTEDNLSPGELGQLVPTGGGDPIPLLKPRLLIGRRGACDIALKFPNVSSRHCELELRNGYWHVRDAGSTNGIKVNGVRCDEKFLMPGDELTIAKHRYEVVYEADASAPPPEEENIFAKSLMEKAGLDRKPKRRPRPRPVSPSAETPPAVEVPVEILDPPASYNDPKPMDRTVSPPSIDPNASPDDIAMDFLSD